MLFNSAVFVMFFGLFLTAYIALRAHMKAQNLLILAGSYFFYGWWDERFLILIALSTACDFICGLGAAGSRYGRRRLRAPALFLVGVSLAATCRSLPESLPYLTAVAAVIVIAYGVRLRIEKLSGPARRKAYLVTSLVLNLGLLGVFKYFGFFAESFIASFTAIGLQVNAPLVHIILPVGISFYTFQTLSYTIDIYRKDMQPTRDFINFAAYVSFFPQLVAGPIERARHLLPQFEKARVLTLDRFSSGAALVLWGLFKKIAIADNLAPIANAAFADPAATPPALMLVGILAFSFQIYCDFSGYTDMARGLARILGFDLMLNFNLPYISRTPSEFWRRWHISLSSWLRDYLYIPLGGNRGSKILTYRNLFLTMVMGGLWHGAAWTFVAWGAFHGGILALYRFANIDRFIFATPLKSARGVGVHIGAWAVMCVLTMVGWTFFRAETIGDAGHAISGLFTALTSMVHLTHMISLEEFRTMMYFLWPLLLVQMVQASTGRLEFLSLPPVASWQNAPFGAFAKFNLLLFFLCGAVFLAAENSQEFIYFDF